MGTHLGGLRARLMRHGKAALLIAVGALAGGAALAVASVPDSSGQIHVCYTVQSGTTAVPDLVPGNLSVIDPSDNQTCAGIKSGTGVADQEVTFNQAGIQGPAGATGAQGPAGVQGTPGLKGDPGVQGPIGLKGDVGLPGPAGSTGPTGSKGTTGLQGQQGTEGTNGLPGTPGTTGIPGTPGTQGSQGPQGNPGAGGSAGPAGPAGASSGVLAESQTVAGTVGEATVVVGHGKPALSFGLLSLHVSAPSKPRTAGKPSLPSVTFTKPVDSASPALNVAAGGDTEYPSVTLKLYRADSSVPAVQYVLTNVLISSLTLAGATGTSAPTQSLALRFEKITITYSP